MKSYISAAGLIVIENNKILMVERKKDNSTIAIPGGKSEPNEDSIITAIRETYEETGIVCYVPEELNLFNYVDEGFVFTAFRAKAVAGTLRSSPEGRAFWLDLTCFKNIPNILQYPEWSRQAIKHLGL